MEAEKVSARSRCVDDVVPAGSVAAGGDCLDIFMGPSGAENAAAIFTSTFSFYHCCCSVGDRAHVEAESRYCDMRTTSSSPSPDMRRQLRFC